MKIKTLTSKQILLIYLLKSKTYEQIIFKKASNFWVRSCLMEILVELKKALQIIFNYHKKNKLILFVGLPENLKFKINKFTLHAAFSKYSNLEGNISNVSKNNQLVLDCHSLKENFSKSVGKKKPYLIVLLDHVNIDAIIKESYSLKIPLICVNIDYNKKLFFYHNLYKVSINQNFVQLLNNFFSVGLSFLFKQSKIKL